MAPLQALYQTKRHNFLPSPSTFFLLFVIIPLSLQPSHCNALKQEEDTGVVKQEENTGIVKGDSMRMLQPSGTKHFWRYCDGFVPTTFEDVTVDINPYPPRPGRWMSVTVTANILATVSNPIIYTNFRLNGIIPFSETRSYCDKHTCPVQPGRFSTTVRYYILPFISGAASGEAKVMEAGNSVPLVCVNIGPVAIGGR